MKTNKPTVELPAVFKNSSWKIETFSLETLAALEGPQARTQNDEATIRRYEFAMRTGAEFPPILIARRWEDPEDLTIVDGFHRLEAAIRVSEKPEFGEKPKTEIKAIVVWATADEVIEASLLVNTTHGKQLTSADNKKRIEKAHLVPKLRAMSTRELAKYLGGLSHMAISRWRKDHGFQLEEDEESREEWKGKRDQESKFWVSSITVLPATATRPRMPSKISPQPLEVISKMIEGVTSGDTEDVRSQIGSNVLKHGLKPKTVDDALIEARRLIDGLLQARKAGRIINAIPGAARRLEEDGTAQDDEELSDF